ncbi:alpha/beta-Hydrolases superfamily protein [Euphorbia peplus]|nr:alpha/beta-Hydrolases superfamily protein [Euphorbia peplus]
MAILRRKPSFEVLNRLLTQMNSGIQQQSRRTVETLAFEEVRCSKEKPYTSTAFILHGLLGSARNWRSFSRNLANSSPEWRMVLVDLRNHGKSAELKGMSQPHDMFNAAKDLSNLIKTQGWDWPDVVIGHSMGGKVALQFAQSCAAGHYGDSVALPKQLWILDSVPGEVTPENSDGQVEKVLKTLQSLPSSFPSRRWLVNHIIELGFSKSLAEWIGTNLKKNGEQETWAFNLEAVIQMFDSYRATSYWPLLENPPKETEISMVIAENSDRWDQDIIKRIENLANRKGNESEGKVSHYVLPNSGHWVHVDNPKGLLEIVAPKIASVSA